MARSRNGGKGGRVASTNGRDGHAGSPPAPNPVVAAPGEGGKPISMMAGGVAGLLQRQDLVAQLMADVVTGTANDDSAKVLARLAQADVAYVHAIVTVAAEGRKQEAHAAKMLRDKQSR